MIVSIPDKFLIEIESEKYFMRNGNDSNNKKEYFNIFEEIDKEYINSIYN